MHNKTDNFLRSINIKFDSNEPTRLMHFEPTAKSTIFLKSLIGKENDKAFFITAPYGSGKSINAAYLIHLIENNDLSDQLLLEIEKKLNVIDKDLYEFSFQRRKSKDQGIAIILHSYSESLFDDIKNSTNESVKRSGIIKSNEDFFFDFSQDSKSTLELLRFVVNKSAKLNLNKILLIWDEFGKHIEKLIETGKASDLIELQNIAEFVNRISKVEITLGLLLHQNLFNYGRNLPINIKKEWSKIEGRFKVLQYIDDSKEIYNLISKIVDLNNEFTKNISKTKINRLSKVLNGQQIFKSFNEEELTKLISKIHPLNPLTLHLLPRISGRIAQNERTIFGFLNEIKINSLITPDYLFDYFANQMKVDTGPGGCFRQYSETQSALNKLSEKEKIEEKIIKTTCILGLGLSGERNRVSRELLSASLLGVDTKKNINKAIEGLIERKLLLYRKHNDDISVWHGTDYDLRSEIEDYKNRIRNNFDLTSFLNRNAKPPIWKPTKYNDDYFINRYFLNEYKNLGEIKHYLNSEDLENEYEYDGKIIYLLLENNEEINEALKLLKKFKTNPKLVFTLPKESIDLEDTAIEIECLEKMKSNPSIIESDPVLLDEINQLEQDSRSYLQKVLSPLINPELNKAIYINDGVEKEISSSKDFKVSFLSSIMEKVYPLTPKINNEMIVRNKITSPIVNARKKLILAMLERSGEEDFGLDGFTPDVSIFRTAIKNTGLYTKKFDKWIYEDVDSIDDAGLKAVCFELKNFFSIPSRDYKNPKEVINKLKSPPYGIRDGILPVLFVVGMKAYSNTIELFKKDEYVKDILPSTIEEIFKEPENYKFLVLGLNSDEILFLKRFYQLFQDSKYDFEENDLIRNCFDSLENWKLTLPVGVKNTSLLSKKAQNFRNLIYKYYVPNELLLEDIPKLLTKSGFDVDRLISDIKDLKMEIESLTEIYLSSCKDSFRVAFGFKDNNVSKSAKEWSEIFPKDFVSNLDDKKLKGFITRTKINYSDDLQLINSISDLLLGISLNRWEDKNIQEFENQLKEIIKDVEERFVFSYNLINKNGSYGRFEKIITKRISDLNFKMVTLLGEDKSNQILKDLIAKNKEK